MQFYKPFSFLFLRFSHSFNYFTIINFGTINNINHIRFFLILCVCVVTSSCFLLYILYLYINQSISFSLTDILRFLFFCVLFFVLYLFFFLFSIYFILFCFCFSDNNVRKHFYAIKLNRKPKNEKKIKWILNKN